MKFLTTAIIGVLLLSLPTVSIARNHPALVKSVGYLIVKMRGLSVMMALSVNQRKFVRVSF
ncbi:hypothetical protein FG427_000426 [Yersinia enterocolitica]|nr:hypothetical protein [Yersinia enterocolitica]EKN4818908.1 hypothetical protein [Yersinia enterocolitica]EKN4833066.1 hypothetical protein [Yersinia enterocolitica]